MGVHASWVPEIVHLDTVSRLFSFAKSKHMFDCLGGKEENEMKKLSQHTRQG